MAQSRIVNAVKITRQDRCRRLPRRLGHGLKKVGRRSDKDDLVPAFIQMMESIDGLVNDAHMLV